jgi:hypothetical protein
VQDIRWFAKSESPTMDAVFTAIYQVSIKKGPPFRFAWFQKNAAIVCDSIANRQACLAFAEANGHDITTCECAQCLDTHVLRCECRHHRDW